MHERMLLVLYGPSLTRNSSTVALPARSPDLSPTENVWSMVAERWARHHTPITTVEAAWLSVPVQTIQSLFDSMPRRKSAVITARGGCFCITRTSNERPTETVLFSGMCAHVRETYVNFFPFPADKRASTKMATNEQKAFCVPQLSKTESAITVQRELRRTPQWTYDTHNACI
ncbi:uncharacterized protein TNCV_4654091 [Trichonephila clavipes]|nr:uncharacterized protein TNCV_4654091 [Trichonephila clavipes]